MKNEVKVAIFAALITMVSSAAGYILSTWQHSQNLEFHQKSFLAERKYEVFVTYMKSVSQSWAQFKTFRNVKFDLRQKGIDAYDEMRLIAPDDIQQKADILNVFFGKLYADYQITDDEEFKFNEAYNELKLSAKQQFIF